MSKSSPNHWNVVAHSLLVVHETERPARLAKMDKRQQ